MNTGDSSYTNQEVVYVKAKFIYCDLRVESVLGVDVTQYPYRTFVNSKCSTTCPFTFRGKSRSVWDNSRPLNNDANCHEPLSNSVKKIVGLDGDRFPRNILAKLPQNKWCPFVFNLIDRILRWTLEDLRNPGFFVRTLSTWSTQTTSSSSLEAKAKYKHCLAKSARHPAPTSSGISAAIFKPRLPVYRADFNVRTLRQTERQAPVALTLNSFGIDVYCVSETRTQGASTVVELTVPSLSTRYRLRTS
ncbi:hypothetical protein CLF_106342, partial [Clonorchis sinensis]